MSLASGCCKRSFPFKQKTNESGTLRLLFVILANCLKQSPVFPVGPGMGWGLRVEGSHPVGSLSRQGLPFPRRCRVRASPGRRQAPSGGSTTKARKSESAVRQRLCGQTREFSQVGGRAWMPTLLCLLPSPASLHLPPTPLRDRLLSAHPQKGGAFETDHGPFTFGTNRCSPSLSSHEAW